MEGRSETGGGDRILVWLLARHFEVIESTTRDPTFRIYVVEVVKDEPAAEAFAGLRDTSFFDKWHRLTLVFCGEKLVEPRVD